jgi:hypothetical protein
VHTGLHSRHRFQRAFQQGKCSPHWRVGAHITDFHIADGAEPATFLGDLVQQRQQGLARLLVRQRHDVVFDGTAGHVHVAELARRDGCVVTLDAQTTSLEAPGEFDSVPASTN